MSHITASVLYRYQVNITSISSTGINIMRTVTFRTCETGKNIRLNSLCVPSD